MIDCIDISKQDIKKEIDLLTDNGTLIEAVIGVHPFHTLFFPSFHQQYPTASYYGTPRHLRNFQDISWKGSLLDEEVRSLWEGEGVFMRIPDGAEFDTPAEDNHFSSVLVYHERSRTLHVDDTINYLTDVGFILRLLGKNGKMEFWQLEKGLYHTEEAPRQFREFIERIIHDWDFDNICAAHNSIMVGGAKQRLQETLVKANRALEGLSRKWGSSCK